jgi:hypothetical protein
MLTYRALNTILIQSLVETNLFTFVGNHTAPPETVQHVRKEGLPAVLIRLQQMALTQVPSQPYNYTALARVEFLVLTAPDSAGIDQWHTLMGNAMYTALHADSDQVPTLIDQSTSLTERLEFRFVVTYKVTETLDQLPT